MRQTFFKCVLSTLTFLLLANPIGAQDKTDSQPLPDNESVEVDSGEVLAIATDIDTVIAAIVAEAKGDLDTRDKLLRTAIETNDSTPARWHAGQISQGGENWNSIEECVALAAESKLLDKYNQRRATFKDLNNVESNLKLASWCAEVGLMAQARAHLERVIDIEQDHQLARNLLGYRRVGNDWISPQEISRIAENAAKKQASIEKYGKQISKLIGRMNSRRAKVRDLAIENLMELKEKDAVGAVESALSSEGFEPSKLAIDWMSQIDNVDASQVLSRYALMHPDENIRTYATSKLASRPKYDYVPDMLAMLSSPISMTIVPNFDRNGALTGYRQAFAREDFDGKEFVAINRGFERTPAVFVPQRGSGFGPVSQQMRGAIDMPLEQQVDVQIAQQAAEEVLQRAATMVQQNQDIAERNRRIAKVISVVSEQSYSLEPKRMWEWWDRYNETDYQSYKPERYQTETITTSTPRMVIAVPSGIGSSNQTGECFVAGTPVMTCHGLRRIEEILTGDLVLSRNITTGELTWNPVIRPTVRPPSATVNFSIDGESFRCSTGHLFWVSGKGWKRANELVKGDVLHGAKRPSVVTAISPSEPVETHNLEVTDNSNYFVGKNLIMTHDVTPRETNRQTVPGEELLRYLKK